MLQFIALRCFSTENNRHRNKQEEESFQSVAQQMNHRIIVIYICLLTYKQRDTLDPVLVKTQIGSPFLLLVFLWRRVALCNIIRTSAEHQKQNQEQQDQRREGVINKQMSSSVHSGTSCVSSGCSWACWKVHKLSNIILNSRSPFYGQREQPRNIVRGEGGRPARYYLVTNWENTATTYTPTLVLISSRSSVRRKNLEWKDQRTIRRTKEEICQIDCSTQVSDVCLHIVLQIHLITSSWTWTL